MISLPWPHIFWPIDNVMSSYWQFCGDSGSTHVQLISSSVLFADAHITSVNLQLIFGVPGSIHSHLALSSVLFADAHITSVNAQLIFDAPGSIHSHFVLSSALFADAHITSVNAQFVWGVPESIHSHLCTSSVLFADAHMTSVNAQFSMNGFIQMQFITSSVLPSKPQSDCVFWQFWSVPWLSESLPSSQLCMPDAMSRDAKRMRLDEWFIRYSFCIL